MANLWLGESEELVMAVKGWWMINPSRLIGGEVLGVAMAKFGPGEAWEFATAKLWAGKVCKLVFCGGRQRRTPHSKGSFEPLTRSWKERIRRGSLSLPSSNDGGSSTLPETPPD